MSHQVIKQPDGLYAIWSTTIDNFVVLGAVREEVIDHFVVQAAAEARKRIIETMIKIENDEKAYFQFTMSFQEALEELERVHGKSEREEVWKYVDKKKIKQLSKDMI